MVWQGDKVLNADVRLELLRQDLGIWHAPRGRRWSFPRFLGSRRAPSHQTAPGGPYPAPAQSGQRARRAQSGEFIQAEEEDQPAIPSGVSVSVVPLPATLGF